MELPLFSKSTMIAEVNTPQWSTIKQTVSFLDPDVRLAATKLLVYETAWDFCAFHHGLHKLQYLGVVKLFDRNTSQAIKSAMTANAMRHIRYPKTDAPPMLTLTLLANATIEITCDTVAIEPGTWLERVAAWVQWMMTNANWRILRTDMDRTYMTDELRACLAYHPPCLSWETSVDMYQAILDGKILVFSVNNIQIDRILHSGY